MYERMARGATFNFSQSNEVAALEITVAMPEFPKWRIRLAGVEDIANCVAFSICAPRVLGSPLPLWKPYMFNCRTKDDILVCLK